jgi:hypothetical protein
MTYALIANIILMTSIVVAIVGLLAGAIGTSRPQPVARTASRRVARRAPRLRPYSSYQGVKA